MGIRKSNVDIILYGMHVNLNYYTDTKKTCREMNMMQSGDVWNKGRRETTKTSLMNLILHSANLIWKIGIRINYHR